MAESPQRPEQQTDAAASAGRSDGNRPAADQQQAVQVQIDDSRALTAYANYYRVAGMPEELILDFGLNTQPIGVPNRPIPINLRVILNYYTAKRMLHALQLAVQRHEAAFGVLEIDIQKRLKPGATGR